MKDRHEPRVTYATFRHRIVNLNWTVEKAINTPAKVKNRDKDRRMKVWFHRLRWRIRHLFKKPFRCTKLREKK